MSAVEMGWWALAWISHASWSSAVVAADAVSGEPARPSATNKATNNFRMSNPPLWTVSRQANSGGAGQAADLAVVA